MKKQPTAPSIAEFYHEQTKYSPETISALSPNVDSRPEPFKTFVSKRAIDLQPGLAENPTAEADSTDSSPDSLILGRLSRLLHYTAGITKIHETVRGPVFLRAVPSAGALYPSEIYLATRAVGNIPDGIHSYNVRDHTLVPLWDGDFCMDIEEACFRHPASIRANVFLILTGLFQRSSWRYLERAYRRILLDAGHVVGNVIAYASREGYKATCISGFYDDALNNLLFLDSAEEATLLVMPLLENNESPPAINSPFPFPSPRQAYNLDHPNDRGVMRLLHDASVILPENGIESSVPERAARSIPLGANEEIRLSRERSSDIDGLSEVISRRRSTRTYRAGKIPISTLEKILDYAYAPTRPFYQPALRARVENCTFADPTLLTTIVVIHRVEDINPGVFVFDPRRSRLALVKPGDVSEEFGKACLGQQLGRDASAVIVHTADLTRAIRRYGDRAYRYLHLDAGHLGQRINLAATASQVGVSGIAGFFDDDLNTLLGLNPNMITVYITTLGCAE